jgi:hypothetical protein
MSNVSLPVRWAVYSAVFILISCLWIGVTIEWIFFQEKYKEKISLLAIDFSLNYQSITRIEGVLIVKVVN